MYAVFQTTHMPCLNMDTTALHLAHNNFENNAKVAFSELRRDEAFSDVQLVCDDDAGVAVVTSAHKVILAAFSSHARRKTCQTRNGMNRNTYIPLVVTLAHKVILAASSPFFNSVLRGLTHPKPLLYLKGVPQK